VRGNLSCAGDYDRVRAEGRWFEENQPLRHRPHKVHFCGFCEEACPVDAIVETRVFEYHGEKRGDLYYTKQMLLAVGDRYEVQIAKDREIDSKYR
jgi:formate hydrogenlyase subunit 6/NADH:ubiquinone oxidoreductase subunit I